MAGADASIYGLIQQAAPLRGPLDQESQFMQLRDLMNRSQLDDLALNKARREADDDESVRQAALESDGNLVRMSDLLMKRGLPDRAFAAHKQISDRDKQEAEINAKRAETNKVRAESYAKNLGILRDTLARVTDGNGLARYAQLAHSMFGEDATADIPTTFDPATFNQWRQQQLMTAEDLIKQLAPLTNKDVFTTTGGTFSLGADGSLLPNTDVQAQRERERKASKTDINIDTKPPTEGQAKAILFGTRMENSNKVLEQMEKKGVLTGSLIKQGAEGVPLIGDALSMGANALGVASEDQQMVEQAQRDFINAVIRRESGATIQPHEFANARKQYFAQPGDSPAVLNQKKRNRDTAIAGFKAEAGAKYEPVMDSITDSYGPGGSGEKPATIPSQAKKAQTEEAPATRKGNVSAAPTLRVSPDEDRAVFDQKTGKRYRKIRGQWFEE